MSEVKRISVFIHGLNKAIDMVEAKYLDRVTAERDALQARLNESDELCSSLERSMKNHRHKLGLVQQRLTAADERADVLEGLLRRTSARLREGGRIGWEDRSANRIDAALKPAEAPRNQCDGCQAGIPLINGTHRMGREGGYPDFMGCSAKLYKPAEGGGDENL